MMMSRVRGFVVVAFGLTIRIARTMSAYDANVVPCEIGRGMASPHRCTVAGLRLIDDS